MKNMQLPLTIPIIGRDIPDTALPARLYRGAVTKARYADLLDPESLHAACIQPGYWQASAKAYLATADLVAFARQTWHKYEDEWNLSWDSTAVTLSPGRLSETVQQYVVTNFPDGTHRATFAQDLLATIRPMVEHEANPVQLFTIFKAIGRGGVLHTDLHTERRGILTLPTPGVQSTWLDISPSGLGFSGQDKHLSWPEAQQAHLAEVMPGNLLIASGQLMPKCKWAGHVEPSLPKTGKGRFVTILNLMPSN